MGPKNEQTRIRRDAFHTIPLAPESELHLEVERIDGETNDNTPNAKP